MLSEKITEIIETSNAKVSVILKDLIRNIIIFEDGAYNIVPSASTIKILIMVEALRQVKLGKFRLTEIIKIKHEDKADYSVIKDLDMESFTFKDLIMLMIIVSDNTAANVLIDLLGFDSINGTAKHMGLLHTELNRKMMDFEAVKRVLQNITTARDMARILEQIYKKEILDEELCNLAVDILCRQKYKDSLLRYIPEETVVAHKTGVLEHIGHDIGIFYLPKCEYILGVFVTEAQNTGEAQDCIGRISKLVYDYFNNILLEA